MPNQKQAIKKCNKWIIPLWIKNQLRIRFVLFKTRKYLLTLIKIIQHLFELIKKKNNKKYKNYNTVHW